MSLETELEFLEAKHSTLLSEAMLLRTDLQTTKLALLEAVSQSELYKEQLQQNAIRDQASDIRYELSLQRELDRFKIMQRSLEQQEKGVEVVERQAWALEAIVTALENR